MLCDQRLQLRHAQLGRLLDQRWQTGVLDQRKGQHRSAARVRWLWTEQASHAEHALPLVEPVDRGRPLSVSAVEERDRVARFNPHDRAEVVPLLVWQDELCRLVERRHCVQSYLWRSRRSRAVQRGADAVRRQNAAPEEHAPRLSKFSRCNGGARSVLAFHARCNRPLLSGLLSSF